VTSLISYSFYQLTESEKQKRDAEEMGDAMKSLENRTLDSKREMDILAALDEMKSMKVHTLVNVFYHTGCCHEIIILCMIFLFLFIN
jgi:hypothetical protein